MLAGCGVAVLLVAWWVGGHPGVGMEIFPLVDSGQFQLRLRAPDGTPLEQTEELTRDVLDAILALYMEDDRSIEDIVAAGFERTDVERVTRLIKINDYKRRQAPVGIRITHRAFGRDWRYPITSKFRA